MKYLYISYTFLFFAIFSCQERVFLTKNNTENLSTVATPVYKPFFKIKESPLNVILPDYLGGEGYCGSATLILEINFVTEQVNKFLIYRLDISDTTNNKLKVNYINYNLIKPSFILKEFQKKGKQRVAKRIIPYQSFFAEVLKSISLEKQRVLFNQKKGIIPLKVFINQSGRSL